MSINQISWNVCPECGSPRVQRTAWLDLNGDDYRHPGVEVATEDLPPSDSGWCVDCDAEIERVIETKEIPKVVMDEYRKSVDSIRWASDFSLSGDQWREWISAVSRVESKGERYGKAAIDYFETVRGKFYTEHKCRPKTYRAEHVQVDHKRDLLS